MEDIKKLVSKYVKASFDYEIYLEITNRQLIEVSDEKLENLVKAKEAGLGVRVLKENRMGFAYTTDLKEDAIKDCVERAMEICELTPPDEGFSFNCQKPEGHFSCLYDEDAISVPAEDKVDMVVSLEKKAKSLDSRIKGVRKVSLSEKHLETYCHNSCGLEYYCKSTFYRSLISALAEEKGDASISYDYRASRRLKELDLDGMVKDVVFKATSLLHPEPYETKVVPVILFRDVSASLLEAFGSIFLGEALLKDRTPLKGKVGESVCSDEISIIDDGTLSGGYMSFPFDAEGIKTKRNVLVDRGVLRGFLHSLYTAKKLKTEPTGNSLRESFKSLPVCGITNLYIDKKDAKLEDLIGYYEEVFLVLDLMGLHTVDPVSGDFSLGASGIIYKRGQKEKSVRGVTISGNVLELWKSVVKVGSDLTFYGNVGSPSLLIEKLTVGG